jgi:hypothetical protein
MSDVKKMIGMLHHIIENIKKLKSLSTKFEENENNITFVLRDLNSFDIEKFISELLNLDEFFSFKVVGEHGDNYFKTRDKDVSLDLIPDSSCLCERHEEHFEELKKAEGNEWTIEPFERFQLYKDISDCTNCSDLSFNYSLIIFKDNFINWVSRAVIQESIPDGVKVYIWSTVQQLKENYPLLKFYKSPPKPTLFIICEGDILEQDGFINVISATIPNFDEQVKIMFNNLKIKKTELQNIIEKNQKVIFKASHLHFIPAEYWIDTNTKELEKFNEVKKELLNIDKGFFISFLWSISDKISHILDSNELVFYLERDYKVEFKLEIKNGLLVHEEKTINIENEKEFIRLYEEFLYSKYTLSNLKIIKDTIILAGDANFLSILSQPQKLLRYYRFHYENLLEEKVKERSEIVKTFVNASQTLKNKLINEVGDITKNFISIVTVLLGLLLSFVLIYGRSAGTGIDFAFFVVTLFSLFYIPINIYRIVNTLDLSNDMIKSFYQDMDVLIKIYRYNFHELVNVKQENYNAERKLKNTSIFVMVLFLLFQVILIWLIMLLVNKHYSSIVFHHFISRKYFLTLFFMWFVFVKIYLLVKFITKVKIVNEHSEVKKTFNFRNIKVKFFNNRC